MEQRKDIIVQVPQNQYFIAAALDSAAGSKTIVDQTGPFHSSNTDKVIAINVLLEPGQTTVDKSRGFSARLRESFEAGENQVGYQIPWIA